MIEVLAETDGQTLYFIKFTRSVNDNCGFVTLFYDIYFPLVIVILSFYHNVLGTDVLMSILAVRKLYCSWTKSAPKVFVKKASENQ